MLKMDSTGERVRDWSQGKGTGWDEFGTYITVTVNLKYNAKESDKNVRIELKGEMGSR